MKRFARITFALMAVTAVSACGGVTATSAPTVTATPTSVTTAAATAATPTAAPTQSETEKPSSPATSTALPSTAPGPSTSAMPSPAATLSLVGLGDSIAGAGHCGPGCRSYVLVYGDLAAATLGIPVATTNLGRNDDLTSAGLLQQVRSDATTRDDLAAADIVTIDIGWNDWQGPCAWNGFADCLSRNQQTVEANLDATIGEISQLRASAPTAIRVVTYANPYVGHLTASDWQLPAGTEVAVADATFLAGLKSFNAMLCRVAAAHDGSCVDILPAFNGTTLDQPIPDELLESQAQMDLIAQQLDAAGYAPLAGAPAPAGAWVVQGSVLNGTAINVHAADGTKLLTVPTGAAGPSPSNPDWSPDGQMLTFVGSTDGRDDLWTARWDGSNLRRIYDCEAPCDYLDDPAWAPDGQSVAACEMRAVGAGHVGSLVEVDVETGSITTLYVGEGNDFCAGARWSPDGRAIVMEIVHRDGSSPDSPISGVTLSIVELTADPLSVLALTDPTLYAATADWSADGQLIVYSALASATDTSPDLFTIKPDGSALTQLTHLAAGGGAQEPGFDPSGQSVVFVAAVGGLQRVDLSTGVVSQAFANRVDGRHPRAQPIP